MHRDRNVAFDEARSFAEHNHLKHALGCHPSRLGKSHTLERELVGLHVDLAVKISPAVRGRGIKASPMANIFLKLAGIEDCETFPGSSKIDNSASMAFALFNALIGGCELRTNN